MKTPITLGITTAGTVAAAVVADEIECAGATPCQALDGTMACVLKLLAAADVGLDDVQLIAVCRGPGSFTGLRICVAFAKSVSQARDLPIVGVSAYDVAEFGSNPLRFPSAAVVQGKKAFYYLRIRDSAEAEPRFARGSREELGPILGGIDEADTRHLADVPASEQAVRVARLGRRLASDGAVADWRHVEIDYGQRPNAVINWEARGGPPERGGAPTAAKLG